MILNLLTEITGAIIIFIAGWIGSNVIIKRRKNKLKKVLGIQDKVRGARVITPVYHKELADNLMHHKDGLALSYILTLLHELGVGSQIMPYHQISYNSQEAPKDTFIIASPISNSLTEKYLTKYCPKFLVVDERGADEAKQLPVQEADARFEDGKLKYGIRIMSQVQSFDSDEKQYMEFPIYQERDYAVLIKIDADTSDHDNSIHLIFGLSATGTAAAAYFLSKHYKEIFSIVKDKSYCLLVRYDRKEGYKYVSRNFENLTRHVFSS